MKEYIRLQIFNIGTKGKILMVKISKAEKSAILREFPNTHIRRTMKQHSKRHNYYCEESAKIVSFIKKLRCGNSNRE